MNRLSRIAVLLAVALGLLVPLTPASAQADPIGGIIVIPGSGTDLTAIRLRTTAGCPAKADAYYATMKGHGFPPDGQIVTSNISAGLSHSFGFDVYVAQIMRDFAAQNHTTLSGRYDITVLCIDSFTVNSYGEFTGSLEFTSPTAYGAIGAAKLIGPPPAPLALAADGSALAPAPAPPSAPAPPPAPAGAPPAGVPPAGAAKGQLAPPPTDKTVPTVDPRPVTSQRDDVTRQSVPWLVVVGAVLVTLVVVAAVAKRIRKRRSS
jgi:hypothetical protein